MQKESLKKLATETMLGARYDPIGLQGRHLGYHSMSYLGVALRYPRIPRGTPGVPRGTPGYPGYPAG